MDRDGSGYIERNELVKIVGWENEDCVNYILDKFDKNGDNKLEFCEFKQIMENDEIEDDQ